MNLMEQQDHAWDEECRGIKTFEDYMNRFLDDEGDPAGPHVFMCNLAYFMEKRGFTHIKLVDLWKEGAGLDGKPPLEFIAGQTK